MHAFFCCGERAEANSLQEEKVFWLLVAEVSACAWLAALLSPKVNITTASPGIGVGCLHVVARKQEEKEKNVRPETPSTSCFRLTYFLSQTPPSATLFSHPWVVNPFMRIVPLRPSHPAWVWGQHFIFKHKSKETANSTSRDRSWNNRFGTACRACLMPTTISLEQTASDKC